MQMKDLFGGADAAGQPSNSRLKWKQKALAAGILGTISVGAFVAVESAEKGSRAQGPGRVRHDHAQTRRDGQGRAHRPL